MMLLILEDTNGTAEWTFLGDFSTNVKHLPEKELSRVAQAALQRDKLLLA